MTIDVDELPRHVDGYFVGYANHSTLLAYDPEPHIAKRVHRAYVDKYNVRTLEGEHLTPNSVILQNMPPAVLDSHAHLDPSKVNLGTSCLNESNERLDPNKCATIVISLPPTGERFGLRLESNPVYGFPVLNRVEPTSPLRTQIPMSMQRNCWIVDINSKKNGHIEPITAQFLVDKLKLCQTPGSDTKVQITFHRKIKPVTTKI